ncbi:MAG: tRNA (N(6)-L-threonylcarbamoyladenosine(37)-C(2))-methylthiotransferase [Candidatus Heimdallarchaeota archaeon]|nr:tRNA (N(6)-L-threonylcarbamoyladenosine(37)-C(2))-methylthiotransferase [Candidatus Heimdallarchaeota archaeon]
MVSLVTKFFIETFGCTANVSASELMSYLLQKCNYEKTEEILEADFVIINTCIVKAPTESKIKDLLKKIYLKYPLIVAGCLPQIMNNWCHKNIPNCSFIGVDHFSDICEAAHAILNKKSFEMLSREAVFCEEIHRDRARDLTGIIEISKGCTGECAYCAVKIAKGPLVSKSPELILAEAETAILEGCKELWITAQDTASYGLDIDYDLPSLIKEISKIEGDFKIRIGMMNPDYALPIIDKLKIMYQNSKVYSFAHIPLQSGSNYILNKMLRKYTVEDYEKLINNLRKTVNLTLSTDIITGFPEESDEDFKHTIDFLKKIQFDIINISKYGDREGTLASLSKEKLPTEIIKKRSSELTKIVNKMTLERNKLWIGWTGSAIALRRDDRNSSILFRNNAYKLISVNDSSIVIGQTYNVKIEKALKTRLVGRII